MGTILPDSRRGGWIFLVYGIAAALFGVAALLWPDVTVLAVVLAFGALSIAEGVISLLSMVRRNLALPAWLLVVYALLSIAFGVLAIAQPARMATALLWLLALWLVIAGFARIVFAIQVRKLIEGEWLLALSGVLAIVLGALFLLRPGIGLLTIAMWVAVGALFYGALQIIVGVRLLRRTRGVGAARAM